MRKKILILNTGGTISCIKKDHGYEPVSHYVEAALLNIPLMTHPDMPEYVIQEFDPLLDSSNMRIDDWNRIATCIAQGAHEYDGFVIFHGTDTMAYTAAALSFMLQHLNKPLILTGSQIPLSVVRNDAMENIITSLWLCAHQPLREVCIYFNQKLLRGNRARKVSAQEFTAFDSPNYSLLAEIGVHIDVHTTLLLPPTQAPFELQILKPHPIMNVRLFPGMSFEMLHELLQQPLRAFVLETYGAGNAPNNNAVFLDALTQACARGMIIVNSSQCPHGRVEMNRYATGATLLQAGLVSAHDMTPEAVHCKLLYLLSKYNDPADVKLYFDVDLCGEMSASPP